MRRGAFVLAVSVSLVATTVLAVAVRAQPPENRLHVLFTEDLFIDIRPTDALAAFRVWANEITQSAGLGERVTCALAPSIDAIAQQVEARQADAIALRTQDYLRLRRRVAVEPFVTIVSGALAETRAALVVGPQSTATSLDDLRGRGLLVVGTPSGATARLWLETEVLKRGAPSLEAFFGEVRTVSKPSQAVLPVFFGQSSAGLVDDASLAVLGELNPQIARQVKVLRTSAPLLAAVICSRADLPRERREKLLRAIESLADSPRGQQTMALFKSSGMTRYNPATLPRVEALVAEHDALVASLARRAPAVASRSTRP